MNYAMPLATMKLNSRVRPRTQALRCSHPATARPAANEEAARSVASSRTVEPMLLVHQQRAETFRLIAVALRDGFRMLRRSFASLSGVEEKPKDSTGSPAPTHPTPAITARTPTIATTTAGPDSGSSTPFQPPRG